MRGMRAPVILLVLLLVGATGHPAPRPRGSSLPGHILPPLFRHFGLMPMGAPNLSHALWKDFAGKVTTVVLPLEEVDGGKLEAANTHLHYFVDAGKWDLATGGALLKRMRERFPKRGWTAGWLLNGDVGAMVTNLREFAEFRKQVDSIRPGTPVYIACPNRKTA